MIFCSQLDLLSLRKRLFFKGILIFDCREIGLSIDLSELDSTSKSSLSKSKISLLNFESIFRNSGESIYFKAIFDFCRRTNSVKASKSSSDLIIDENMFQFKLLIENQIISNLNFVKFIWVIFKRTAFF